LDGAPTLDIMLNQGRNNHAAYTYFVNVYLLCSKGRGGKDLLGHSAPSRVFTICDEVLVMWYMENNWHIWADMKSTKNTKTTSLIPKYTVTGDKGGGGNRYSGWSTAGKERFNELFKKVTKERESVAGAHFDAYYASLRVITKESKKKKKPAQKTPTKPIKMLNTLSSLVLATNCAPGTYPEHVDERAKI
jgi:hypothetical protein